MSQDTLFDMTTDKVMRDFLEFHAKHPNVYRELLRLTWEWKRATNRKLGISMLYEQLRWQWHTNPEMRDKYDYKLNNNYKALYAREIMTNHPELEGIFEIRERKTQVI